MSFSLSQGPFTYNRFDEASKPDYLDFDKDKNKKESMKKALKDKEEKKKDVDEGFQPMTPERTARVDTSKSNAYKKDQMAQQKGNKGEADKQFKRRMAMDFGTKMKSEGVMPDFIKKMKEKSDGACDCKEKKEGKSCGCGKKEKKEQFVDVVRELMAEGYDLSQFTWDGLYSLYESETLLTSSESDSVINKMVSSGLFSESEIALIQNSN